MKELMHALLNYNSEITGKKRKRNEDKNGQCNSKLRKIRKTEEIKDQQEDTLTNQDGSKIRDELNDNENDKEVAGNVDGGALLHKVFWFGKTFGDIIRALQFYVKTNFAYLQLFLMDMKKVWRKIMNMQEECKNSNQVQVLLPKKKWESITIGKNLCAMPETKPSWLSYYHNVLRKMDTVINCEDDADTQIVEAALDFVCEKK